MINSKLPIIGLLSENALNQAQAHLNEQNPIGLSTGILPGKFDLGALSSGQLITGKFGVYAPNTIEHTSKKTERL